MATQKNTTLMFHAKNNPPLPSHTINDVGATLAQLVKAFWAPSGTNHKAKFAISLSGWLGRYTNVEYLQSLYLKRGGQLLFQV